MHAISATNNRRAYRAKRQKTGNSFLLDCDRSENEFYTRKDALYVKGYFIYVTNAMWGRFTAATDAGKARDGARTERAIGGISAAKRGARTTEIGTERIEREKKGDGTVYRKLDIWVQAFRACLSVLLRVAAARLGSKEKR